MAERAETDTARDRRAGETERVADVLAFPSVGHGRGGVSSRPAPDPESPPRLRSVIGVVLREERHDQERTLADVAGAAAVSLPYLSEVERGSKEVSSEILAAICGALDLDLADVLDRAAHRLRPRAGGSGVLALAA
jgi:DNA-binding Xre family transcriptional regulator